MFKQYTVVAELATLANDPILSRVVKLMEEVGELAESVNHHEGYLPHKAMKEAPIGEVADVIINAMAILHRLYPGYSDEYIYNLLLDTMDRKNAKWRKVITNG